MKYDRVVEIRPAEGGEDSLLFTKDLAVTFQKMFSRLGWANHLIPAKSGAIQIAVTSNDLSLLNKMPGGFRLQRVPPTERKGRVHTSTVTVAVIDPSVSTLTIKESDLKLEWYSGTGCGGSNRNKKQNSCRLTHIPTGIVVTSQTRDRTNSLKLATREITERVQSALQSNFAASTAKIRKDQIGSGMRGDKILTIRFQDNVVVNHITGKKMQAAKFMAGYMDQLWD